LAIKDWISVKKQFKSWASGHVLWYFLIAKNINKVFKKNVDV
jgi:hypothetical protein